MKQAKEEFIRKANLPEGCPVEFANFLEILKEAEKHSKDIPYTEIIDLLREIATNDKYSDAQNKADAPISKEEQKSNICHGIRKVLLHSIRCMTHHSF